jgi:hypothetical protein
LAGDRGSAITSTFIQELYSKFKRQQRQRVEDAADASAASGAEDDGKAYFDYVTREMTVSLDADNQPGENAFLADSSGLIPLGPSPIMFVHAFHIGPSRSGSKVRVRTTHN